MPMPQLLGTHPRTCSHAHNTSPDAWPAPRACARPILLLLLLVSLVLVTAALPTPAHAIVNGQAPADDDTRYDAIAAFSHARWLGLNPEHANARDHNWYGNATLIAPDVVILAKHLIKGNAEPPAGEYAVRFRRKPDGSLGSKKGAADSFHNVKIVRFITAPNADLALGILEKPVEHIKPIALGLDAEALDQAEAIIAGWGSESRFRGVGGPRNQLLIGKTSALRPAGAPAIRFPAGEVELRDWRENKETGEMERKPYVVTDDPVVNMFDSGGALLRETEDGQLRLTGVIVTYGGAVSLDHFADDERFPLNAVVEQGGEALTDKSFAHNP